MNYTISLTKNQIDTLVNMLKNGIDTADGVMFATPRQIGHEKTYLKNFLRKVKAVTGAHGPKEST